MPRWGISFWVVGFVVGIGVVGRVFVGCCSQWLVAVGCQSPSPVIADCCSQYLVAVGCCSHHVTVECCSHRRMTVGFHSRRCVRMGILLAAAWCSCCRLRYGEQNPLHENGQCRLFRLAVQSRGWVRYGVGLHCRCGFRESVYQCVIRVRPCRRDGECFLRAGACRSLNPPHG